MRLRRLDLSRLVGPTVFVVVLACAGFIAYAKVRAMLDFEAWCEGRGGQVAGRSADICVDPEGRVIVP